MPYCHVPWTNLDISPLGEIKPCCKFNPEIYTYKVVNIVESSIQDYLRSNVLQEVKKDFNDGVWPKGCERCKVDEINGLQSMRQQENLRWKDYLEDHQTNGFLNASIAFGNTCNLTCIICSPHSSSKWYQEYKKLYGVEVKPIHYYKDDFVDDLYSNIINIKHLDVLGGEPFLTGVDQQKELLQKLITDKKSEHITLHYTTNGTQFPDNSYIDLWKNFKQIEVQVSIDGIDKRFEYLRYPAKWDVLSLNFDKLQNLTKFLPQLKINTSTTVSAFNIAYLNEFLNWTYSKGIPYPYFGRLHAPYYYRPTIWKQNAKEFLLSRLQHPTLESFKNLIANEDDSKNFDVFRYRLLRHDQYRKLSFQKTFPEMFDFLVDK